MDFNDQDNKGLFPCLAGEGEFDQGFTVQRVYEIFCLEVSLADFVVVAAEALMMRTRPDWNSTLGRSPTLDFGADFKFGRTAAANCTPGALPDAQDSCTAVEETFVNAMGLSWEQSAALMGVHTLGRALSHNSGFEGWWSEGPEGRAFSNSYYVSLLAKGWVPQELESGKHQWARGDGGSTLEMMLDSDLCLLFEVTDFNTGETTTASSSADSCCAWADESNEGLGGVASLCQDGIPNANTCCIMGATTCNDEFDPQGSPAAESVKLFAKDEDAWLTVFLPAWRHATRNGHADSNLFNASACDRLESFAPPSTPWPSTSPTATAPTSGGWDEMMVANATTNGDSATCYYALFGGSRCTSAGGVYRISETWYRDHYGGSFDTKDCGTVVEGWFNINSNHETFASATLGTPGVDITLSDGTIAAIWVAEFDCGVPSMLPTPVPTTLPTNAPTLAPSITLMPHPISSSVVPTRAAPTPCPFGLPSSQPLAVPTSSPTTQQPTTRPPTVEPTTSPAAETSVSNTPTEAPTPSPLSSPMIVPIPRPTSAPFPLPTAPPTPAPSRTPGVLAVFVLSDVACAEFSPQVMGLAIGDVLHNVSFDNNGTQCADSSASSIVVDMLLTVPRRKASGDFGGDIAGFVQATLRDAVTSDELTSRIRAQAMSVSDGDSDRRRRLTGMDAVTVESVEVATFSPTFAPTSAPSLVPSTSHSTPRPSRDTSQAREPVADDADSDNDDDYDGETSWRGTRWLRSLGVSGLLVLGGCAFVCFFGARLACSFACRRSEDRAASHKAAEANPNSNEEETRVTYTDVYEREGSEMGANPMHQARADRSL